MGASKRKDVITYDPDRADIVKNLHKYAATAGVAKDEIRLSMPKAMPEHVYDWIIGLRTATEAGMVVLGKIKEFPPEAMAASVTGACVRNFIDARLRTAQDIARDEVETTSTVLVIPDFGSFLRSAKPNEVAVINSVLVSRYSRGQKSIVMVSGGIEMLDAIPEPVLGHLKNFYKMHGVGE